jgi:hypothetical protein
MPNSPIDPIVDGKNPWFPAKRNSQENQSIDTMDITSRLHRMGHHSNVCRFIKTINYRYIYHKVW